MKKKVISYGIAPIYIYIYIERERERERERKRERETETETEAETDREYLKRNKLYLQNLSTNSLPITYLQ